MAVDMRGTFLVTKFLLPLMMEQGGSIINTASFSGQPTYIVLDITRQRCSH